MGSMRFFCSRVSDSDALFSLRPHANAIVRAPPRTITNDHAPFRALRVVVRPRDVRMVPKVGKLADNGASTFRPGRGLESQRVEKARPLPQLHRKLRYIQNCGSPLRAAQWQRCPDA